MKGISRSNYEFVKLIIRLIGGGIPSSQTVESLLSEDSWKNVLGVGEGLGSGFSIRLYQCLWRDWLAIPDVDSDVIQGASQVGKNDINLGQAKSNGVPPDQKSKQS